MVFFPGKRQVGIGDLDQQVHAISGHLMKQLLKNIDWLDRFVCTFGVKLVNLREGSTKIVRSNALKDLTNSPQTSRSLDETPVKITGCNTNEINDEGKIIDSPIQDTDIGQGECSLFRDCLHNMFILMQNAKCMNVHL